MMDWRKILIIVSLMCALYNFGVVIRWAMSVARHQATETSDSHNDFSLSRLGQHNQEFSYACWAKDSASSFLSRVSALLQGAVSCACYLLNFLSGVVILVNLRIN